MSEAKLFVDKFYSERENLVREQIGPQLERLREQLKQLYSPCTGKLMNAEQQVQTAKGLTIGDLLNLEPSKRQMIVTATMYNDALWRPEAAFRGAMTRALAQELNRLRRNGITGQALLKNLGELYYQHNMRDWMDRRGLQIEEQPTPVIICSEGLE